MHLQYEKIADSLGFQKTDEELFIEKKAINDRYKAQKKIVNKEETDQKLKEQREVLAVRKERFTNNDSGVQ